MSIIARVLNHSNNVTILDSNHCGMRILYTGAAALLTLFTICGNLFILIAVRVNQKLRRIRASILIASLAVADLLVGTIVMPLAVVQLWTNGRWELGHVVCQIWTAMDVIACTASISTLCVISVDRYIGVARPLEYSYIMTRKKLWISVSCVWIFSILVLLATVSWKDLVATVTISMADNMTSGEMDSAKCHVSQQLDYVIYSVILSFFIPLLIICGFYYRVYRVAQTRKSNFVQAGRGVLKWKRNTMRTNVKCSSCSVTSANTTYISKLDYKGLKNNDNNKKHNKAAVTLGLVVGAFVLCWLPFFVLFVIYAMCDCVSTTVLDAFTWLGYCNSALNPLIYALSMKTFSETLRDILKNRPFRRAKRLSRERRPAISL